VKRIIVVLKKEDIPELKQSLEFLYISQLENIGCKATVVYEYHELLSEFDKGGVDLVLFATIRLPASSAQESYLEGYRIIREFSEKAKVVVHTVASYDSEIKKLEIEGVRVVDKRGEFAQLIQAVRETAESI